MNKLKCFVFLIILSFMSAKKHRANFNEACISMCGRRNNHVNYIPTINTYEILI